MGLIEAIRFNLSRLATFSGRESRAQFWPYAGAVFALSTAALMAIMMPEMQASFARAQAFAVEHPEAVTIEQGPGHYSMTIHGHHPELMPDIAGMLGWLAAMLVVVIALYAAAVARRLHDRGKTGAWGLLPIPFIVFSFLAMPRVFARDPPDMGLFFAVFFSNFLYLASLVTLVVLLAQPGTMGENRYGPRPQP